MDMEIKVDVGKVIGRCERFWAGMCNPMIETTDGRPLCAYLADLGITHYRADIWRAPGSWAEDDAIAEAILKCGAKPIVIVSIPGELAPRRKRDRLPRERRSGPTDLGQWQDYVYQLVTHGKERFGEDEIASWHWECLNEPAGPGGLDLDTYCRIYDHFAEGALRAAPKIKVGGPNISTRAWFPFLQSFLTHCLEETNYANGGTGTRLDFVSFHSYGGHPGIERPLPQPETMVTHIQEASKYISLYPGLESCEVLVDEWGVSWGGWLSTEGGTAGYEGGRLGYEEWMGPLPWLKHRDNEYAAAFLCKLVSELFFLKDHFDYVKADVLAYCPMGGGDPAEMTDFDGTRCLVTGHSGFRKPLVNAYELLS